MTLEIYNQQHQKIKFLKSQSIEIFKKREIKCEFPISFKILNDFSNKIDSIFEAMLLCGINKNLYSCYILYRCLIEHMFKAYFIMGQMVSTKSDKAAEEYEMHYFISEFLAEQAGCLDMDDLVAQSETRTDFLDYIHAKLPGMEEFDKANQQEISEAIKKFNLKSIIKSFHLDFAKEDETKEIGDFFARTLPEYSKFSTFVHGGTYGTKIIESLTQKGEIEKEIKRVISIGLIDTGVAAQNVMFCFTLHKDDMLLLMKEFYELRTVKEK